MSDEFVDEVAGPGNRIEGGTAKSVVEYIAKSIVDTPEAVDVTSKERGDGVELLDGNHIPVVNRQRWFAINLTVATAHHPHRTGGLLEQRMGCSRLNQFQR